MSDSFQVEVILTSLQDLKQVRDKNERRLAQEYGKRVALESKLEAVTARHSVAGARKTEGVEALKVVSEQASQSEAQASSLEQRAREKREGVRTQNGKIEDQGQLQEEALSDFSVKMTELTGKFRNARAFYTEQNLTSKVEECISDREEGRERVSSKRALLAELQGELSELQRVRSKVNDDDSSKTVSREIWQTFVEMVSNERGVAKTALLKEEDILKSLQRQNTQEVESLMGDDNTITLTGREE